MEDMNRHFSKEDIQIQGKQTHKKRAEKQDPWREPDAGLNPGTPGSHPEPKAEAQLLSHPGTPLHPSLISS